LGSTIEEAADSALCPESFTLPRPWQRFLGRWQAGGTTRRKAAFNDPLIQRGSTKGSDMTEISRQQRWGVAPASPRWRLLAVRPQQGALAVIWLIGWRTT
jgi:hypothetical protein